MGVGVGVGVAVCGRGRGLTTRPQLWRHKATRKQNDFTTAYEEDKRMIHLEGLLVHNQAHGHDFKIYKTYVRESE